MPSNLERVPLALLPTPVHELSRLSRALDGPRLLIKRDDQTGLATGGNKARKLEFLVADALAQGTHTLITAGAVQSNHARQTAAAAARYGLRCILALHPMAPPTVTGNLLLDRLFGAHVRWAGDRAPAALMDEIASEERAAGRVPYVIPVGGSSAVGATGYYYAMDELVRQAIKNDWHIDHIVLATGSGGTQAGILAGAQALRFEGHILGVSVSATSDEMEDRVLSLAQETLDLQGLRLQVPPEAVCVNDAYLGKGYGQLGDAEREAIHLLAKSEGLLLDPVYTGRAMAGLLDLVQRGELTRNETVLFWHTGGTPALFAQAQRLL